LTYLKQTVSFRLLKSRDVQEGDSSHGRSDRLRRIRPRRRRRRDRLRVTMGMSFKVAPGVRVRASSRGLSAGFGPQAARVHVGTRDAGISSGVGPFSTYQRLGGSPRPSSRGGRSRSTGAPTKASIAAYERQLRAAEREADIEKVAALEKSLVTVHRESFPKAERVVLPAAEPVDSEPIRSELEAEAGIPSLVSQLGRGDAPPVAPPPEPVDRYQLMRAYRKRRWQGIPFWRLRDRIEAARQADEEAEAAPEDGGGEGATRRRPSRRTEGAG
jgi:hypothetical protein